MPPGRTVDVGARAAGRDQGPPVGPARIVVRLRLGPIVGVGQRQDDRALDVAGHLADERLGERPASPVVPIRTVGLSTRAIASGIGEAGVARARRPRNQPGSTANGRWSSSRSARPRWTSPRRSSSAMSGPSPGAAAPSPSAARGAAGRCRSRPPRRRGTGSARRSGAAVARGARPAARPSDDRRRALDVVVEARQAMRGSGRGCAARCAA